MTDQIVEVDVVSDIMCPWCYVGKRRLEAALKLVPPGVEVSITWRPFQLDATIPPEGRDRKEYLARKFGGPEQIAQVYEPIIEAGKKEGIPFDFEAIDRSPNTLDAHRVLHWARTQGLDNQLSELFFKSFFTQGKDFTNNETLADLAGEVGMDRDVVARLLEGDADKDVVQKELEQFRQMGVQSVPTIIVGNKYVVVGAQEPETIAGVIAGVHQEQIEAKAETATS